MEVRRLTPGDQALVLATAHLFDDPPLPEATARFLGLPGHHLLFAFDGGAPIGFVSGVELTHPDKGTEMFLYELGVDEPHRRQDVGTALVGALASVAAERGCYGMFVLIEPDNEAARRTYQRAGAGESEPAGMLTWTFPAAEPPSGVR
ncbi:MAG TPA: GNAT family N-acetyltransferase [Candidatus Limnocylindrales bacterium]|jgi:ribosomal protein S18 acetylase RimI-like enzyme